MDSNLSGLEGSTHHLDFFALSAREHDDLTYGWQLCDNCDNTSSFHVRVQARPWSHEASFNSTIDNVIYDPLVAFTQRGKCLRRCYFVN